MGREFYFDTDDRLDRKKYAEFLKTLLEHCDEYRREDSDGAYVIAIDSPWGTGKTRFAKMLRNYLENRTINAKIDAPIDPSRGILTVYYNAWDTDFSTDALEPLIYSLINSPELESELFEEQADEEIVNFINSAKRVLRVIGLSAAHHILGETAAKVLDECMGEDEQKKDEICGFEKRRTAITDFRVTLNRVIEKTSNKKLVIVIDELDRCRPTFAIETLEIVKHLFDVPGLIFIFALDIKQLSYSIETVYGLGIDAPGYLCRFFDYIGKMPDTDSTKFIKLCLNNNAEIALNKQGLYSEIVNYMIAISKPFSLSLRDISTITKTYQVMLDSFMGHYKYISFHRLYLFLIALKYKKVSLYSSFLLHTKDAVNTLEEIKKYLPKLNKDDALVLSNQIATINNSNELNNVEFDIYFGNSNSSKSVSDNHGFLIGDVKMLIYGNGTKFYQISTRVRGAMRNITYTGNPINMSNEEVLNHVLDHNDLLKWSSIKDMSLGQYYYQQLEMFNFALPSDELAKPE